MHVGHLRIDAAIDGEGRFPPTKTFRTTDDVDWQAHQDLLGDDGRLPFTIGTFVVRDGERTVLVDLGGGRERHMGIDCGDMLTDLAALGVAPGDVTDVVFTHLHGDHVGWTSVDGAPTFPNATYRCDRADWDHFVTERPGTPIAELMAPVAERLEAWDGSGPILPGIDGLAAPGHTPGSTIIVLSSGTERALLLGDIAHCPVQLVDDEWAGLFDVDPEQARRTRTAVARELEGEGVQASGAHFPGLRLGRLLPAEGRRRWVV